MSFDSKLGFFFFSLRIMGNCLEPCKHGQREMEQDHHHQKQEEEEEAGGFGKKGGFEKGGFRVKILVTKEDLGLLLIQLREKGVKRTEDVLVDVGRGRGKSQGWKPSLESIAES